MYIHIGDNQIIDSDYVIGIFNYESFNHNQENHEMLIENFYKGKIKNETCSKIKAIVLMHRNNNQWWVYSSVSARTLSKRLDNDLFYMA